MQYVRRRHTLTHNVLQIYTNNKNAKENYVSPSWRQFLNNLFDTEKDLFNGKREGQFSVVSFHILSIYAINCLFISIKFSFSHTKFHECEHCLLIYQYE